ncbi:MAG TPA: type II toxin-antitoxin system RelE/ParE family toxin [Pyrinomonadaceae bacterium]|nr:type II toxin-antitoxin system RelE/ParE family toxin [Pyrinomonadaceae bacterium]
MKLIFHPEAYAEMLESARYFETKTPGLGFDLITAVQDAAQRILRFPCSGPVERGNIRKCLVRGFPFTILYETHSEYIYIGAVMHQHRRPGYWKNRLR